MRTVKVLALLAVVALAVPLANAADQKHSIGVFVNDVSPTSSKTIDGVKDELDSAVGYGLKYRYMFNEKWDITASLFYSNHDVKESASDIPKTKIGTLAWNPLLIDANWHFSKGLYVGPTIGYAMWDDVKLTSEAQQAVGQSKVKIKAQFVYGLDFGWDWWWGKDKNWGLNLNLRYLQAGAKTDEPNNPFVPKETIDVNPLILGVGVSYRF